MDPERMFASEVRRAGARRLLLAVSGGADSMALLRAAAGLDCECVVAHVDHGLRPDSHADAGFVAASARALDLRCGVVRVRVVAGRRESPEAAARRVRYAALRWVAARAGADAIAVAHTADDQAETVLLRLLRGSSARGLGGMQPFAGGILRPFLQVRRRDLREWLLRAGGTWREDVTNAATEADRNWLRAEVMPVLAERRPVVPAVARTADLLAEDDRYLSGLARDLAEGAVVDHAWPALVIGPAVAAAPAPIARRVLASVLVRLGEPVALDAVGRLMEFAAAGRGRHVLSVGLSVHRVGGHLVIPLDDTPPPMLSLGEQAVRSSHWGLSFRFVRAESVQERHALAVPAGVRLTVRSRRPGDRVGVRAGHRLVADVLRDAKVPAFARPRVPVVCVDGEPYGVPGLTAPRPAADRGNPVLLLAEPIGDRSWMSMTPPLPGFTPPTGATSGA